MNSNKQLENIQELINIMAQLRAEDGCQWDRAQTPASLKKHILEETYELLEAIDKGQADEICDELGDLLLQVVFQAQIFAEGDLFDIGDVANAISEKLKRRHPHIFADADHAGHEQRWEEIKLQERTERGQSNSLAQRIPAAMPALKRATKVAKKTTVASPSLCLNQLQQQITGLQNSFSSTNRQSTEQQIGEILQSICALSAAIGSDPEELLRQKTAQLIANFDAEI